MTKNRSTKRALLMSALSLLLCVSMLVGTTYAWFTDEVTSGLNQIVAGNLDIDVYHGDAAGKDSIKDEATLFNDVTLWEPGAAAWENLTVVNLGNLAFKYRMAITFSNENRTIEGGYRLSQILKVGVVKGGLKNDLTREQTLAKVTEWKPMADFDLSGELLANTATETFTDTYGLVIYWEPTAEDNNWNLNNGKEADDGKDYLHIDLGVSVFVTQKMYEEDSFDETYDAGARFPNKYAQTAPAVVGDFQIDVEIPAGVMEPANAEEYTLEASNYSFENETREATLKFDLKLMDGAVEANPGASEYPVAVKLPHPFVNMDNLKVLHKGEAVAAEYDADSRTVSFKVDGFSPFEIQYVDYSDPTFELEYKTVDGQHVIEKGMFFVDPIANFGDKDFLTLGAKKTAAVSDECITVDFEKEGQDYFVVSKEATSVFVAPDGTAEYVAVNGIFAVNPSQSGKLYSVVSGLQNNEYNTLYLLPGTYNEATTIYIYSSMDIIGLGDTDEVKVIKGSSSNSNRHLFNASGAKAEYIEVTIRNLYLDATNNTTGGKDNAAVQSIRKSKVKCYDLNIVKATNSLSAVAFYVNGNNAVDGVKYPAYLYVEDCSLNVTNTFNIVSTASSYKFYHDGLTYGGKTYTTNSGSIKNMKLAANDWDW